MVTGATLVEIVVITKAAMIVSILTNVQEAITRNVVFTIKNK